MLMCPFASRRTTSCASSISSCSNRSCSASSDGTDSAAATRGKRKASRPLLSCNTTSRSSAAGIQPPDQM